MGKRELVTEQPRYIKLNERDNVAIVVNDFGLPAGSRFACGLELRAFVPQGHKTALVDIAEGAPILRYGEVIGYAASPILAGEWVDEARIQMPDAPALDKLEIATAVPEAATAAGRFYVRGLPQRGRLCRHQEPSRHLDLGPMRQGHAGICDQAYPGRVTAEISQCRRCHPGHPCLWLRRSDHRRPTPWCRSGRCKISPSIRISAARSWWSGLVARSSSRNGWCPRVSAMPSCGCRMKLLTALAPSSNAS